MVINVWGKGRAARISGPPLLEQVSSIHLQHNPNLLEQVSEPGLALYAVPEVRLAKRLHEFGLLPEENRKLFVQTVSNYALEGQDGLALDDEGIQSLFTEAEFDELVQQAHTELLPRLADVRRDWDRITDQTIRLKITYRGFGTLFHPKPGS